MAGSAAFTICANNYLHYAASLRETLKQTNPEIPFFIFIVDEELPAGYEYFPDGTIINARVLDLNRWKDLTFKYSVLELSTAIKPSCIKFLLSSSGFERVVYLDPDIWVMKSLDPIFSLLRAGKSAVLTPHICHPIDDDKFPQEIDILRAGTFNLGFCGFSVCDESLKFLKWWERKLADFCYSDVATGLFVDQKWCDFAPSFLSKLHIARDPGYNLAYWNLHQRDVTKSADGYSVDGSPLFFVHFSGIDVSSPEAFSRYQDRYTRASLPSAMRQIYDQYLELLLSKRRSMPMDPCSVSYSFNTNDRGQAISPTHRSVYRAMSASLMGNDPFSRDISEFEQASVPDVVSPQLQYLLKVMTSRRKALSNFVSLMLGGSERRKRYWMTKFYSRGIRFPMQ